MNERAQGEVSHSNLHVPCRLKVTSRNSTINLESPYSSQDPKKEVECAIAHVQLHSRPHCLVEATYHIELYSRNKVEHNQFSRSQDIEAGYARAHVHSDTPWAGWSHITHWSLATCQISAQSVHPFPRYRYISVVSGVCTCARAMVTVYTPSICGSHITKLAASYMPNLSAIGSVVPEI